jgi:integrase
MCFLVTFESSQTQYVSENMPKLQLTPALVSNAHCPADRKRLDMFDIQTKGLVLEVRESGGKTYYLRYQNQRGRTRQLRLADAKDVSLSQARALADKARNKIAMGEDPCDEKAVLRKVPTFGQFVADQYLPYVKTYKRSWDTDISLLKNHLLPRFENRYLDTIVRQDIIKMHHDRRASGAAAGSANRLLIMMRYIFNLAIRWDAPGIKANPCAGVPLLEVNNKKERYLSVDEAQRLYEAVRASENTMLQYIVPMLILTGARKREVLDAQWQDFDLARRIWRIPMSKSGKSRYVPLGDGAMTVLSTMPRSMKCEWAFANPQTNKPFVSVFCAWNTARKNAGLADVRMHDLRHSFASLLVNSGRTLYEVQQILGHTQVKTTQRYAHLSQDTLLDAANAATRAVGSVMLPGVIQPPAKSLQIC